MSEDRLTSNATWAGMIALGLRVTVSCTPCNRSVEIDLTKLPPDGAAIGAKFRCRCGRYGQSIVSPRLEPFSIPSDFYGKPSYGPRPDLIVKRRRRR